jgi:Dolichyl-phosphate-mannose-protein mannosyltransferase
MANHGGSGPRSAMHATDRAASVISLSLLILLSFLVLHAVYFLWVGLDQPALDLFNFRQTQTAWSAYWLWRDGFRLAYETPVLGYPWAIPFEFPLYQELVALLRKAGVPIDVAGRLLSFAFYIGTLYPLWILTKALNLGRLVWLIAAVLFLASPFYVYWSRTVMVESCALFFSVFALALIAKYLKEGSKWTLLIAFIAGSLGVLTKATTFPAYAFLAGLLVLAHAYADYREGHLSAASLRWRGSALAALIAAILVGAVWTWYTDEIKSQNPFGDFLTSVNLAHWNFGSWQQRISADLWRKAIFDRALPEIFGYAFLVACVAAAAALQSRRYAALMLGALIGFLLPFLLFTNLHLVHNYYQNANALLGLAAVALGIVAIIELGQPLLASIVLVAIVGGQLVFFYSNYAPVIRTDFTKNSLYRIARSAKDFIPPDQTLLVIGQDWSSAIPYYSERKSLAVPNWMPLSLIKQALDDPERFFGGQKLGGIVHCTGYGYNEKAQLVEAFIAGRKVVAEAGPCKLLSPTR